MKMYIGIIEDEAFYKEQLIEQLDKWALENSCETVYHTETSGENFLSRLPKQLDILFLDIQLTGINGVELAQHLRKKHYNCEIVNVQHIQCLNGTLINMSNGVTLPVSKTYLEAIRNGILNSII